MLTIDELKAEFPRYNKMIDSALKFLDEYEPTWNLDEPIDRTEYVNGLVEKAMVANNDY